MTTQQTWLKSLHAQQYFACEKPFLEPASRQAAGPAVLQLGPVLDPQPVEELDLPMLIRCGVEPTSTTDLLCDAAFVPFAEKSLSSVLLPHVLEQHELPHQVLREAHRVLQSDGHLVLTGFNPFSFLGMQRKMKSKAALSGRYYTPRRVIDWLQLLGFEVLSSSVYQYAPLSKSPKSQKMFAFLESLGGRCLPMFGGAYMITAKKRDIGMTLLGKAKYARRKTKIAATVPAKTSLRSKSS